MPARRRERIVKTVCADPVSMAQTSHPTPTMVIFALPLRQGILANTSRDSLFRYWRFSVVRVGVFCCYDISLFYKRLVGSLRQKLSNTTRLRYWPCAYVSWCTNSEVLLLSDHCAWQSQHLQCVLDFSINTDLLDVLSVISEREHQYRTTPSFGPRRRTVGPTPCAMTTDTRAQHSCISNWNFLPEIRKNVDCQPIYKCVPLE